MGDRGVPDDQVQDDDDDDDEYEYDDDEERIVLELGIDMIESALKAKLAEVAAKHAIGHAGLAAAAATDAALGLQWDETMAAVQGKPKAMQHAAHAALVAHKEELATLIGVQLRALAAESGCDLDAPTVRPVMLTSSDAISARCWSGAKDGSNDHEGVQAIACVSGTWALVVANKSSCC